MDQPKKTNRLAALSFTSGLIVLISTALVFTLYNLIQPTDGIIFITDGILIPVRNMGVVVALVTGILAHWQIKKKSYTEKGKWLAWGGIILGGAWILFGVFVGLVFLISTVAQLW